MSIIGKVKKMKDELGNYFFPITSTKAVFMEDGTTRLSDTINDVKTKADSWDEFKSKGGTIGSTIIFPKGVTRQTQQVINMRNKDYTQRSGLSNYNGYPCWSAIIEDPEEVNNTNGLLFMLGTGIEGDAYRDNYLRPLKMGYSQKNNIGSVNIPWDDIHLTGVSKSTNGYTRLPNGLIMQWGRVNIATGNSTSVNLPITFPNAILSVQTTGEFGNTDRYTLTVGNTTTSKISIYKRTFSSGTSTDMCFWMAIGY